MAVNALNSISCINGLFGVRNRWYLVLQIFSCS